MATDVSIDYQQVQAVSKQLNSTNDQVIPMLQSLHNTVRGLLQGQGLHLNQTSPALTEAYTKFDNLLVQNIHGLTSFAKQFDNIVSTMQTMDQTMSTALKKNG